MKETSLALICLFVNLSFLACQSDYGQQIEACKAQGYFESQDCMIGKALPEFSGVTYDGKQIGNSTIANKITVINFWFMACGPCIAELDGLNAIVDRYESRDDIVFLSFTTDEKQDIIERFLPHYQLKFEIIPDAENTILDVFKSWWGFPTTIVIDKSGKIHKIFSGGKTDEEAASKRIESTLIRLIEECLKK